MTEMRCVFHHFKRSCPETLEFIDAWLEEYPDSAFANAAKAHSLFWHSAEVRGNKFARPTHPDALAAFNLMQSQAWSLAIRADELRLRFVRAAEILIQNANGAEHRKFGLTIFRNIVKTDPNVGTYNWARNMHKGQWGWTWKQAKAFCDEFAPSWEPVKDSPVRDCQLKVSTSFKAKKEWRLKTLNEIKRNDFDHVSIAHLVRPDASAEDAAAAYKILPDDCVFNGIYSSYFDNHLAQIYDYPFLTETIRARQHEYANSRLKHDPYNVDFLEWLVVPPMETSANDKGQRTSHVIERLSPEIQLDYDTRILTMKPFDARAWVKLQRTLGFAKPQMPIAKSLPLSVNAICYGNHEPDYLVGYMMRLLEVYDAYGWLHGGIPEELQPHINADALERMMVGIDAERDLVCLFVRASRLCDHVCTEKNRTAPCHPAAQVNQAFAIIIINVVKTRGICSKERSLPVETLYFSPVADARFRISGSYRPS